MITSFDQFFEALRQDREFWVTANRRNKFERGIRNATVEKYADPTHFIYELLQNAEDQAATKVRFRLEADAVTFEHDGNPFTREDVEGVTGLGNTTKIDQANKIGCFGIGFKSVFVVTDRPEVHCTIEGRPIAFAIRDLVVPELIAPSHSGAATLIRLPLAPDTAQETLAKVREALAASGARSLLFLDSIKELQWTDAGGDGGTCRAENRQGNLRVLTTSLAGQPAVTDRFLILSRPVRREEDASDHCVKIALRMNEGGNIVPEPTATRVAVFFETEDLTGLHFQVHGPFQLTDNRANIKRGDKWNALLVGELAALLVESLPELRERGLVTRGFLEVMPNPSDDLPEPWHPIREAVATAFRTHPLVPAHSGGHVAGQSAVRGPADLRDALGDEGLSQFAALADARWVTGGLRSGRIDAFLTMIKIPEWGYADYLAAFQRAFTHHWYGNDIQIAQRAQAWFDALPDDQVQRLYLLVDAATRGQRRPWLGQLPYVRLEDGSRVSPGDALLLPAGASEDEAAAHGLVLVKSALVRTRARGKEVEQFLKRAGVKEIGERDYIRAILRSSYGQGRGPTVERHLQHMRRFLRYFAETRDAYLFADTAIFRVEGAEGYHAAGAVFLGAPYAQSALGRVYDGQVNGRTRKPLWSGYAKLKRAELVSLAAAVGIEQKLHVVQTRVGTNHPRWATLTKGFGGTRITSTQTSTDYSIPQLVGMLRRKDVEIARLVWKAVSETGAYCMYARWAPNQSYEPNQDLSTLALVLQQTEWIPAKDGSFRRPRAITAPELASGFPTSGNDAWLNVIEFAAEHRQRSEQHQQRRKAAQSIGLPPELADRLQGLSPEALQAFGAEMVERIASGAFTKPEFPEREAPNPTRRAERVAERAKDAPAKTYETRERSVRTSDGDARRQAKPYLRDYYTNEAGDMVCQACQGAMPFRLPTGEHYFEAPEFLLSASAELAENHLALCPTCSAKWRYANDEDDADLLAAMHEASAPEIAVTLAGAPVRLRFVQVHFDDLLSIFASSNRPDTGDGLAAPAG